MTTSQKTTSRGLTLIEITLVIGIMMLLASIVAFTLSNMTQWKRGKAAGEELKAVYVAQKSYLADHPTKDKSDFTSSALIPYLPGRPGAMPVAESLEGDELTVDFNEMPPVFELSGSAYDPSDSSEDGIWDVGGL